MCIPKQIPYLKLAERGFELWNSEDSPSPYICDCIEAAADELTNRIASGISKELTDFISEHIKANSVEQFLFKTTTEWCHLSTYFSDEQRKEANDYRKTVLWPLVIDYAKTLEHQKLQELISA